MTDTAMLGTSGYKRREADFYSTPAWCTEALCDAVELPYEIWEPAAGTHAIADVLTQRGHRVAATDISADAREDFLEADTPHGCIVTNPPYKLAEEFIDHALGLTAGTGMVAMLLRNEYDCAASRRNWFEMRCFAKKLVLTKRPKWIEGPLKASPRHNFAWYVWDWKHEGPPTILYGP